MNLRMISLKTCCALIVAGAALQQAAYGQVSVGPNRQPTTQTLEEVLSGAPPIMRVEEDWEVLVADPDPTLDVPQIVTVFGPTDPAFGTYVLFEMNHGTLPSYGRGGMQLQVWWTDYLIGYLSQYAPTQLSTANETVTFTTVTRLHDTKLRMYVINGNSTTWGQFGSNNALYIWLASDRTDLNPYDADSSINNSRVTFGANRVDHYCRKEIRFYNLDGSSEVLYVADSAVKYVHRLASDPTP